MKKKFILIIGGQRCGSSALFQYLSAHPKILPSLQKETRFFLDEDYIIKKKSRRDYDGKMETYLEFFGEPEYNKNDFWYLDSSPDFLNSPGTAKRIKKFFKDEEIQLVAILRDPIERFLSWYRYDKQLENIDLGMPLSDYLKKNLTESKQPPFTRLQTGCYSRYLKKYQELFPNNLIIYRFEDLKKDKTSLISDLLNKINVEQNFKLEDNRPHNASYKIKWPLLNRFYVFFRDTFRDIIPEKSGLYRLLRNISKKYQKMNYKPAEKMQVSEEILTQLKAYYKEEYKFIKALKYI